MVRNASGAFSNGDPAVDVYASCSRPETTGQLEGASPLFPELMRCLRIAEGLNTMTRRGEIGTSLPVFGLRPMRWPFLRTTNEPKDDSFTVSPRSRQSVISLSTSSTSVADSVRDRPTFW